MDLHVTDQIIFDRDTTSVMPYSPILVDPRNQSAINHMFTGPVMLPVYLPPRVRGLMCTQEVVDCPKSAIGDISVRSTWARLGIISPSTKVDPGFKGQLTMEVFNVSNHKIFIRPGDRIWTVHYLKLAVPEPVYKGRYQGQEGIQLPKALEKED